MRVLVCGGREYADWTKLEQTLGDLYWSLDLEEQNIFVLISGGAAGADTLARRFARQNDLVPYNFEEYKADWDKYGKAAGFIRNQQMLDEGKPDLVIAFEGGRGTADMIQRAKKAKIKVIEIT